MPALAIYPTVDPVLPVHDDPVLHKWRRKGGAKGAGAPPILLRWGLSPPNILAMYLIPLLCTTTQNNFKSHDGDTKHWL